MGRKDHIRALARTVPTDNPYWEDWFYTWFLAMVDQWRAYSHRKYGNSVAPLLISKQGYNKSTFCRSLVPPELQWGYNDNLVLSEKRQVLQAMCQSLVINLDEFNQISPQVQQGFLKNIIQLPSVKIKLRMAVMYRNFREWHLLLPRAIWRIFFPILPVIAVSWVWSSRTYQRESASEL